MLGLILRSSYVTIKINTARNLGEFNNSKHPHSDIISTTGQIAELNGFIYRIDFATNVSIQKEIDSSQNQIFGILQNSKNV